MKWTLTNRTATLLLVLGLSASTSRAQETCREGKIKLPHTQNHWQDDFVIDDKPEALCEGSLTVAADGEICITGRLSYRQIAEKVGRPIRSPAADSISINGHLISGSGNVVLGREAGFLYDYVTKYTVGDTEFTAGANIADMTFAASRGLITGVCLDKSFAQDPEIYAISHDFWLPGNADEEKLQEANIIYASIYSVVAEYHKPSNLSPIFGTITNSLIEFAAGIVPGQVFKYIPLLGFTGIFRLFVIGSVSTELFPQAITAPSTIVEDVQIDTEWSTLIAAMGDGLFTDDKVPLYFGVLIKRIEASDTSIGCWKVPTASIDIQAPMGQGDKLDKYIKEDVLPALQARGTVGLHMGKRLDDGSDVLKAALNKYEACGVEMNVVPDKCYHPACTRSSSLTGFEYPAEYYQDSTKYD